MFMGHAILCIPEIVVDRICGAGTRLKDGAAIPTDVDWSQNENRIEGCFLRSNVRFLMHK